MIPTAEEIIKNQFGISLYSSNLAPMDKGESIKCMIEFAKMHVTEALKQANEKAKNSHIDEILNDSILTAYNLENIK